MSNRMHPGKLYVTGALSAAIFWCFLMIGILTAFYDGGPLCFVSPKRCHYNVVAEASQQAEVLVVTSIPSTATLKPLPATPTQWLTPTPSETPVPVDSYIRNYHSGEYGEVDCGRNPYKYNPFQQDWERTFSTQCYLATGDPFEAIFGGDNPDDGLNYSEVKYILELLDISDMSETAQLERLQEVGVWNSGCGCVVGDLNAAISNYVSTSREESEEKD